MGMRPNTPTDSSKNKMKRPDELDALRRGETIPHQDPYTSVTRNATTMSINSQASTVVERDPEKDPLMGTAVSDFDNLKIDDSRKIVVGIDFGTTFSGIAWAETRRASTRTCFVKSITC
jgi:hypothetical protein